jgi:hypothetical protein
MAKPLRPVRMVELQDRFASTMTGVTKRKFAPVETQPPCAAMVAAPTEGDGGRGARARRTAAFRTSSMLDAAGATYFGHLLATRDHFRCPDQRHNVCDFASDAT